MHVLFLDLSKRSGLLMGSSLVSKTYPANILRFIYDKFVEIFIGTSNI